MYYLNLSISEKLSTDRHKLWEQMINSAPCQELLTADI